MSNPQVENGHIDIANDIAEKLSSYRLTGEEYQVLWVIWRKTWGWHKKKDWISLSQFESATHIKKPNIIRTIKKLLAKNIIIKEDNRIILEDNEYHIRYGFNKNFDSWKSLSKKITLSKKIIAVIKEDKRSLSSKIPTKENYTKETITKERESKFASFWLAYPRKKNKGEAEKAWAKIKPDNNLTEKIISSIDLAKQSKEWIKENGDFIPYPATWLNAKGWEDEIEEKKGGARWG